MKLEVSLFLLALLLSGCALFRPSSPRLDVQVTTDVRRMIAESARPQGYMPLVSWSDTLLLTRELGERFSRIFPVLFYESGQSDIPVRYQQLTGPEEASGYRTWQLVEYSFLDMGWTRAKQSEILDVLGKWLQEVDGTVISLQGGYSSEDGESHEVADRRARTVRDYLGRVWGIDPTRVEILPSRRLAGPEDHVLAQQEARTVRIYPPTTYFLSDISFNTTRHPGFIPIGLKLRVDGAHVGDWAGANLVITSGEDTLSRSPLPLTGDSEEFLVDDYALWTIPRDVRYLRDPLRMSVTLTREDGTTVRSDEVPIFLSMTEQGKHREYGEGSGSSLVAMDEMGSQEHRKEFRAWLGEGVSPSRAIRFELNTFSYHDAELSPTHMVLVDRNIEQLRAEIAKDTSRRWRMKVVASVDAIEADGVDPAQVEEIAQTMQVATALAEGRVIDGGIRPNLYFPSESIDDMSSDLDKTYRMIVGTMFEGRDWGLDEFGLRGMGVSWLYPYDTVSLHPRTYPQEGAARRAAGVAARLTSLLDDLSFDHVGYDATSARPFLTPETLENRIRDREVTITFYNDRSYEWFMDETEREWGGMEVR